MYDTKIVTATLTLISFLNFSVDKVIPSIKEKFNILLKRSTVYNWIKKYGSPKNIPSQIKYVRKNKFTNEMEIFIKDYIINKCYFNKRIKNNLKNIFYEKFNIEISNSTIYKIIKKYNITIKKIIYKNKKIFSEDHLNKVNKLKENICKIGIDKIISIDETHFKSNMNIDKGYSKRGEKIYEDIKYKGKDCSLISAITNEGILINEIIYTSVKGDTFFNYITKKVIPSIINLKKLRGESKKIKYYLFMDNARIHKTKKLGKYIKNKYNIEIIYNIPNNPDTNPIENIFGILKKNIVYEEYLDTFDKCNEMMINIDSNTYIKCYYKSFFT